MTYILELEAIFVLCHIYLSNSFNIYFRNFKFYLTCASMPVYINIMHSMLPFKYLSYT